LQLPNPTKSIPHSPTNVLDPQEYQEANINDPDAFFSQTLEPEVEGLAPPLLRAESSSFAQRERTLTTHMKKYWQISKEPKGLVSLPIFFKYPKLKLPY